MPLRTPDFWQTRNSTAMLLRPVAALYQWGYRLRRRYTRPVDTGNMAVLCIGNLVAGGAGKTPVALAVGEYLRDKGCHACYLSKGYGGGLTQPTLVDPAIHHAADVGDEPLLLTQVLPTLVARDRGAGLRMAKELGFALVITDDGFQNPKIKPDLALVVADAAYGFGNGYTLPAGPLREPVESGLARADALIAIHRDGNDTEATDRLPDSGVPRLDATLRTLCPPLGNAKPKAVVAFSGIARPDAFFAALKREYGAHLVAQHGFADHHLFSTEELDALAAEAQAQNALLMTTAKDAVRLPATFCDKVVVAKATLDWHNDGAIEAVLAPLVTP